MERLQKYLATAGIASRRACEALITQGKVKVNGVIIHSLGTKIDPEKDIIEYEGKIVNQTTKKIYLKLNKPKGYLTTCGTYEGPTVIDLLSEIKERIYPIGRLDINSKGLLLFTNDGDLAQKLTHPKYEHEKEYECEALHTLTRDQIEELTNGITLSTDKKTAPAKLIQTGDKTFTIILKEGKNRQIRRMVAAVDNKIVEIKRVRIANIKLGNLQDGKWEYLSKSELQDLLNPR